MGTDRDWSNSDYVRVYQTVRDDPKFATVYPDDRAFAAYVRLLMDADVMFPVRPPIPATLGKYAREVLVRAGILVIQGTSYTLSGLSKERLSRFGKNATGRPRYPSDGTPKPERASEPTRSEAGDESESVRNGSEPHARPRASDSDSVVSSSSGEGVQGEGAESDPYDEVVRWLASRQAWVDSPKIQTALARMVDKKGAAVVIAAMAAVPGAEDAAQFVYGARNNLFPLSPSNAPSVSKADRDRAEARAALGLDR